MKNGSRKKDSNRTFKYRCAVYCTFGFFRTCGMPCHIDVDAAFIKKYQIVFVVLR